MKLYTGDLSPYSAKIRMQIYAMGIADDIEFELPLAQFFSGRLKETSPIGRIPILKTDAGVIPESEVIADYLDELYPEKSLLGTTAIERANVRVISRIADIYLMNNIFLSLGQLNPDNRNQAIIDLLMSQVKRGMAALATSRRPAMQWEQPKPAPTAQWFLRCLCANARSRVLGLKIR